MPTEFAALAEQISVSQQRLADLLGYRHRYHVNAMARGRQAVPPQALALLRAAVELAGHTGESPAEVLARLMSPAS